MTVSLGEGPSSVLDSTYGAYLIGVFFATFLQGLLTVQAWNYYESFPNDPWKIKILVLTIWILDTVHLVVICQTVYHYLVTNWGFVPALDQASWELTIHIVLIGFSCFVCQMFFLHRIWIFSRKNYLVSGTVLAFCLVTLAISIHLPIRLIASHLPIHEFPHTRAEPTVLFISGAITDLVIAGLLCYYLRQDFVSGFEATKSVLGQILQYTVATGLMTSALAVGAVIANFVAPTSLYYIALHLSLGRLYTNSLLVTLNARTKMREALNIIHNSDSVRLPRINNDGAGFEPAVIRNFSHVQEKEVKTIRHNTSFSYSYTVDRMTHRDGDIELDPIPVKRTSLTSVA